MERQQEGEKDNSGKVNVRGDGVDFEKGKIDTFNSLQRWGQKIALLT